jgi:hypothetical protein
MDALEAYRVVVCGLGAATAAAEPLLSATARC